MLLKMSVLYGDGHKCLAFPCLYLSTLTSVQVYISLSLTFAFLSLDFPGFIISAHSHCPCNFSSYLHPCPCSLGYLAVLLQILPFSQQLSQSALMPWTVLAIVGSSLQEGDRTGPFLELMLVIMATNQFPTRRWKFHYTIYMLLFPLCHSRESPGKGYCVA